MFIQGDLSYAGISVLTVLSAGIGAYIGAYLKKKGENLATHEDIDKLLVQIRATTEATKSIEARISSEVWDRQRQWELKRDAVLAVIQALSAAEDALMETCTYYLMSVKDGRNPMVKEEYDKATLDWKDKLTEFESKRTIAKLICGEQFNSSLTMVRDAIRDGMKQIMKRSIKSYDEIGPSVSLAMSGAVLWARIELGLPD